MSKKFPRKIAALCLCMALMGMNLSALAFSDIPPESDYEADAAFLEERGVITGYQDGTFQPDAPLTVGMLVTLLGRIAGDSVDQNVVTDDVVTDIMADGWSGGYMLWAVKSGLISDAGRQTAVLTGKEANDILAAFSAMMGVETVTVSNAGNRVSRGDMLSPLVQLAKMDINRLANVTYTTVTSTCDWGPVISRIILDLGVEIDPESVSASKFDVVHVSTYGGSGF